jgi:hypothetical protein
VELLPAGPPVKNPGLGRSLGQVSRRDFVAFAIGAASVLVAIFVGWLVARLAGH